MVVGVLLHDSNMKIILVDDHQSRSFARRNPMTLLNAFYLLSPPEIFVLGLPERPSASAHATETQNRGVHDFAVSVCAACLAQPCTANARPRRAHGDPLSYLRWLRTFAHMNYACCTAPQPLAATLREVILAGWPDKAGTASVWDGAQAARRPSVHPALLPPCREAGDRKSSSSARPRSVLQPTR